MIFVTPSEALNQTAVTLRQHRIRQNLTQKDLAHKSGVTPATLRKFERTGIIALGSFFKLAASLGLLENILTAIEPKNEYASLDDMIKENKKKTRQRVKPRKKS
ncbi:MAG: helix-turn-helix transcriptional regulator [Alphaproteobacteria bacterium]